MIGIASRHLGIVTRLAFLGFVLVVGAGSAAEPEIRDPRAHFFTQSFGDLPEELEAARAAGKLGLLLFFEQEGCPYCARMERSVLNRADVQDWYNERFVTIAVDINGDVELTDFDGVTLPSKVFARHRRVFTTPTLSFIDFQGAEVHRRTSMVTTPEEFLRLGRYVAEGHYTDTTWQVFNAGAAPVEQGLPELESVADFRLEGAQAKAEGQVLMVAVMRRGCPYCAALRRDVLLPMTRNPTEFGGLRIRELVMEPSGPVNDFAGRETTSADLAADFGVTIAPTVLFLDGDGRLLSDPVIGYNSADTYGFLLDRSLEQALGESPGPSNQSEE